MVDINASVRVGGSGLTVATFRGQTLSYLQTIQDTAPTPVAQAVPVQAIGDATPREIVTALAVGAGTLRLTFYEVWNKSVWQFLNDFAKSNSLLDVFKAQLSLDAIQIAKIIKDPRDTTKTLRTKTYQKCKIVDIDDGEQVNIGTMVMPKGISVMYAYATVT
jgi:hypothetical protein